MPKNPKRRPPNRRGGSGGEGRRRSAEPELDEILSTLLDDPHPLGFLAHASTIAEVLDAPPEGDHVDLAQFIEALNGSGSTPSAGLLILLDAFLPGRVPAQLVDRRRPLPVWLARLDDARVSAAALLRDTDGGVDEVVIEITLVGGATFCLLVLVDHDAGTTFSDGFAIPVPIDEVLQQVLAAEEDGLKVDTVDVADAAARLREADEATAMLFDPPETDSWPQCRPLLRWAVGLAPDGGSGWPRQAWTEPQLEALATRIVARRGRRIGPDAQDVVLTLLRHAATHALGDPLRWSERSIGWVLDWIDEHVVADEQWHDQVPEALRRIILFAHRERGVPAVQTADLISLVSELDEPDDPEDALADLFAGLEHVMPDDRLRPDALLRRLAMRVGGDDVLDALHVEPPQVDIEVPEDVEPRLQEITALIPPVVAEFFADPELADVAATLLRRAAAADPAVFRRRSDPRMTAAAALWIVAKVNDAFGLRAVQDMMAAFGLKGSPSQRATSLLNPLGLREWLGPYRNDLGDAALLTAGRRRSIVSQRDAARAAREPDTIPSTVTLAGGETVRVVQQPGSAAAMMEELRPFLTAQGVDLDDLEDIGSVQAAMDIAVEARNQALFTPEGARRAAAAAALRDFSAAIAIGDDDGAIAILERIEPEARDPKTAEVAAVIGLGLELLDEWLDGMPVGVPIGLGGVVLLPRTWRKRARPGQEIVALASHGRAFSSHGALIARHGGEPVLAGVLVAVAATTQAWAAKSGTPIEDLLTRLVR